VTAAHPALPLLIRQRGSVNAAPDITVVSFNGAYQNSVADLETFVHDLVQTPYWTEVTAQYGVGTATVEAPIRLAEPAPGFATGLDIRAWLANKIQAGAPGFAGAGQSSFFVLLYPRTSTIVYEGLQNCQGFGGYHASTTATIAGQPVYTPFAVIPECGPVDGGSLSYLELATTAASHELVEGVTDPFGDHAGRAPPYPGYFGLRKASSNIDPYFAWSPGSGHQGVFDEAADMCNNFDTSYYYPTGFRFMVQRSWSNANALVGKDPCAPAEAGPYFLAQPVFDPNFAVDEAMMPPLYLPSVVLSGGQVDTQGIRLALGEHGPVPLILWSEAPVGDWVVSVTDPTAPRGTVSPYLQFSLDRDHGNNGDTLMLTITVTATDARYLGHPFEVTSSNGLVAHSTYGWVANP
jgi:hypothetical protein